MKQKSIILVVDDDPNVRKTLADILSIKGYAPHTAANGAEALTVVGHEIVSLALIDLKLPDMTGIEVMTRIKAISPTTEVIILTGHASMDTAIESIRQGAFSYILKPYQMDDLLLNIRHGIERMQAQEEILHLASHPRLNPNPVIESSLNGEITYINPAAERLFPHLDALGTEHPLLVGIGHLFDALKQRPSQEVVRETTVGQATYELHFTYVQEANLIRIYVLDITQRKQMEASLVAREHKQTAVADLGTQALTALDLPSIFERAVEHISSILGVDYCILLEHDKEHGQMLFHAAVGWSASEYKRSPLESGEGTLAAWVRTTSEPIYFSDLASERRFAAPELLQKSAVVSGAVLPILAKEMPFGLMGVFSTHMREFASDDQHFIQAIVNVVAAAVLRKQAEDEIHVLASTDSLTGIANRREFDMTLEKEIARCRRYGGKLSLVMYDLDHFKRVNDTYGHDVGDDVLKEMTGLVRDNIRETDTLGRWGGEEFLILSPGLGTNESGAMAEKLRQKIADHDFDRVGSITVSFGVVELVNGDDAKSLFKRVDDALYKAKESGRNRVVVLDGQGKSAPR